jgi:alkanesulfonate monooxygenase SsuD/methylene tetrahydromethanopterin reductase-like flavin-dependent oxidoreductase (luciferase family)
LIAERLGFEEFWVGEHFSATSEPFPSPLMFMASLVPQTERLVFGTGVINLPNRHPAVIAGEVAQFDHLSGGRFIFGAGTGSLPSDYELFDVADVQKRQRMLLESLDMIERIWRQDPPYEFAGEFWNFGIRKAISRELGIGFMPKPLQQPGPPIAIAVSSPNSPMARIAGGKGWGIVSSGLSSASAVATHGELYRQGAIAAGRQPDASDWRIFKYLLVAGSDAEARERVFHPESSYRYLFGYLYEVLKRANRLASLKPDPGMRDDELTVDAIIEGRVLYGSPATVAEKLTAFRDAVGPFGRLLATAVDWGGPNAAWERESMHRLAEEVMPLWRRRAGAQAAE